MKITLYLADKLVDFRLPIQVSGSFSFDENPDEENKLINISAKNNRWVMYKTDDTKIYFGNTIVEEVPLEPNNFYGIHRSGTNYLIFVSEVSAGDFNYFTFNRQTRLIIGNNNKCNICYIEKYMDDLILNIYYKDDKLILERIGNKIIFVNKKALKDATYFIKYGDEIEMYGLIFYFFNGMFFIKKMEGKLSVHIENANIKKFVFPIQDNIVDMEIKELDLYKKDDYYLKPPRIRRVIENKKIKLSAPPKDSNEGDLPIFLVLGPMLTMGIMSITMLANTIMKINSKETTVSEVWPQLVSGGAMLISMLVWPLITHLYNQRKKKKRKQEINTKYHAYLEEKRKELLEEQTLQKDILFENLNTTKECLEIIRNKRIRFWDKRIDQNDFLTVRLGIGRAKMDVDIEYPEEGFTIDESDLQKKADALVKEFEFIENAPVGYSFLESKTTAVMGDTDLVTKFINNILLQMFTFHNYEDLKVVLFTNEQRKKEFEHIRYLNHCFNSEKTFRFFASDSNSIKILADYMEEVAKNRLNQLNDDKSNTLFKPYFLIIIDDYDRVKRHEFIKTITEVDANLGCSLIILENTISKLPSKCNNFINIGTNTSSILRNSYENQTQTVFVNEFEDYVNMFEVSKQLANIPIELEEGIKYLPEAVTFLEMEKVGNVEQLNILNRWNTNDSVKSLKAEVGIDEQGELMYLDLHEKYHGPHGLIAGMTGSGKSEFIITYILSLAMNYSPDDVAFALIDYKGGGLAFAFDNKDIKLPHLAGTITNLDKAEMDRTLVSIDSEVKRRQHMFNEAREKTGESTIDIYKYQKYYKEGILQEPIPHLFIICDEFAELKTQQPDFMDNLISIARIGRSLGVHLILATQKPSGVVNDQIWSNTKFRVCLKVQDESDSREMLKRPEAASIKQTGRFYLQVGFDEYFAIGQSGWCGAKYYPKEKIVKQNDRSINFIDDNANFIKSVQAFLGNKEVAQGEQLLAVLKTIVEVSLHLGKQTRRLWLDNIPAVILINELEKKYNTVIIPYDVCSVIGEYDAPENQRQGLVHYNYLREGNTLIYGTDGSERENLLQTILYSTVKNHTSSEINYYIVDYGSEILRMYNELPHIGGIVFQAEEEKYFNLLKMLKEEFTKRKRLFTKYGGEYKNYIKNSGSKLPIITVIINNYDSLYDENPNVYEDLPDLVRDSERYGIVFIITANAVNSVQSKISQNFHNIYTFKLKDSSDYASLFDTRSKGILRDIEGRGFLKLENIHEFQTASILQDKNNLSDFVLEFINSKKNTQEKARPIPILPDFVRMKNVEGSITTIQSTPVGISKKELEIYHYDFLSSLGNVVASNKLINTKNFIMSLIEVFSKTGNTNTIVFDPSKLLDIRDDFPNYYVDEFDEKLDAINNYITKLVDSKSNSNSIIIIYGLGKFISKIEDINKMNKLSENIKKQEKVSLIVVDDPSNIKGFSFDSWFTQIFNLSNGIWIGRGAADQSLIKISTITREMTADYKNDMGYVVSEGSANLCRLLDFITEEDKNEE